MVKDTFTDPATVVDLLIADIRGRERGPLGELTVESGETTHAITVTTTDRQVATIEQTTTEVAVHIECDMEEVPAACADNSLLYDGTTITVPTGAAVKDVIDILALVAGNQ